MLECLSLNPCQHCYLFFITASSSGENHIFVFISNSYFKGALISVYVILHPTFFIYQQLYHKQFPMVNTFHKDVFNSYINIPSDGVP